MKTFMKILLALAAVVSVCYWLTVKYGSSAVRLWDRSRFDEGGDLEELITPDPTEEE